MDFDTAYGHLKNHLRVDPGRFYYGGTGLSLGVGQFYLDVHFPIFNEDDQSFDTAIGIAYILTHECDIDQNNRRPFNTYLLICPVIDFRNFVTELQPLFSESDFISFLARVGKREVSRLIYIPHYQPHLPYGGLLYLNRITHTHVNVFANESVKRICSVTNYGLKEIDAALENHLLRPKDEQLAGT
ncbi:MAG: hypothetical protein M0Z84_03995 [Gammaproteobacteria bacterium]|nr:hypothetical protein [Gammaproteobacteria bacterium]